MLEYGYRDRTTPFSDTAQTLSLEGALPRSTNVRQDNDDCNSSYEQIMIGAQSAI